MTNIQKYLSTIYTNPNDKGRINKAFECAVREYFAHREVKGIAPKGKADCIFTYASGNKRLSRRIEIKTACGDITWVTSCPVVVYCPEIDIETDAEAQGYVFTREEWTAFVNGYTGRGSFTRVNSRGELHIQSFRSEGRPKASKPIAEYIWSTCMNQPTVEEWCKIMRGK